MAVFAISDLHLSTANAQKSMDVFGQRWSMYTERLEKNWRALVRENDTVIIPGDISWELSLEGAAADFHFIDRLPGKKIISKGNHDFWWSTVKKMIAFFERESISSISLLHNNAYEVEDFIIAGTRGWYQDEHCENMPANADFEKLISREAGRLKTSLDCALALQKASDTPKEILVFLHFPVIWNGKCCQPLLDILENYGIRRCFFGHIHANYAQARILDYEDKMRLELISSDFLEFIPQIIRPISAKTEKISSLSIDIS
ncbi:MAG: metallophosphoesterase [Clostridia bacterium]|nr:metallophosphoesterase [Clostridia bacterium]